MKRSVLLLFVLGLAVLAGCLGPTPTREPDPGPPALASFTSVNITREAATGWQANHFVFRASDAAVLALSYGNGRPRETPDSWEGCGWIEFGIEGEGQEPHGGQIGWGESRGHALVYATDGSDAKTVNHSMASDDLSLGVNFKWNRTDEVVPNAVIDVWLFEWSLGGEAYQPFFQITSDGAPFELMKAEHVPFVCGANLSHFTGDFVDAGMPAAWATRVDHATTHVTTNNGSEGAMLFGLNPRFGGTCSVAAFLDGRELNRSVQQDPAQNMGCYVSWDDGPGSLELRIEDSTAYDASIVYVVIDR